MAILLNRRCSNELAGAKHAFPRQVRNLFRRAGGWGENRRGAGWSVVGASIPTLNSGSMKPLCEYCGTRHESYQAHVFATNTATNRNATNNLGGVLARSGKEEPQAGGADFVQRAFVEGEVGHPEVVRRELCPARHASSGEKTQNRRSRESYNAYQREYMRKKRRG
jgi:hypothetical protein